MVRATGLSTFEEGDGKWKAEGWEGKGRINVEEGKHQRVGIRQNERKGEFVYVKGRAWETINTTHSLNSEKDIVISLFQV